MSMHVAERSCRKVALMAMLGGLPCSFAARPAAAGPISPYIEPALCLQASQQALGGQAGLALVPCAADETQNWTTLASTVRTASGLCLTAGAPADPCAVWAAACDDSGSRVPQRWRREGSQLAWLDSGFCLAREGGDQASLRLAPCDVDDLQQAFVWLPAAEAAAPLPPATSTEHAASAPQPSDQGAQGGTAVPAQTAQTADGSQPDQQAGTFLGFAYISLDAFVAKHPMLRGLRQDLLDAAASRPERVPATLLAAIAMEESSGNPAVPGGLMQFTWAPTWAAYGEGDINNARDSLFAAARYLEALRNEHKDDLAACLTAYNGAANAQYVAQIRQWLAGGFPYGPGT